MSDKETLANLMTGVGQNLAFNLDFIPADKFDWKPAPTANSAREIVHHILGALGSVTAPGVEAMPVADAEDAKSRLTSTIGGFVQALHNASPEQLAQPVSAMQLPLSQMMTILVFDTINHHGQITYIQTLLGDTESHFAPDVLDYFK